MIRRDEDVGDQVVKFDGVELSNAYVIPKAWRKRMRVKVKDIRTQDDGSTFIVFEMPEPACRIDRITRKIIRVWTLGITVQEFSEEQLNNGV